MNVIEPRGEGASRLSVEFLAVETGPVPVSVPKAKVATASCAKIRQRHRRGVERDAPQRTRREEFERDAFKGCERLYIEASGRR